MKIILSHGYFLEEDAAEQKIMMPYPPQGLMHVQAYFQKHGIEASILDPTFSSFKEMTSQVKKENPDILGLYCNLVTRVRLVKLIKFIRDDHDLKDMILLLGGPDVRYHQEEYLAAGADVCVIGEGEEAMRELVITAMKHLQNAEGSKETAAANIRNMDQALEKPLIKDLDTLPFPDFDQVPIQKYLDAWKKHHGHTSLTFSTMRGCPYTCRWCSKAVYGNTYRRRSPGPVVKELARLNSKYHPDQYWFVDDVFTISRKWLSEFSQELKDQKVTITYECITRADTMDDETIRLLVESGCKRVWIGAESGSQKVLDLMDRRVKAEQVREMILKSREAGMEAGTFLMLGYPGESLADIKETLRHLVLAKPDLVTLTLSYPIKGTAFYDLVAPHVKAPGAWGTYTDRDLTYPRTYAGSFYRHAVRYLHHGLEAEKAWNKNQKGSIGRYLKHKGISLGSFFFMHLYRKNGPTN